jgi:hypothetical protein
MTYVKRIFYLKDFSPEEEAKYPNQEALKMFRTDPEGYRRRVQECVRESQKSVFLPTPGSTVSLLICDVFSFGSNSTIDLT